MRSCFLLLVVVLCLSLAAGCIQVRRKADVTRDVLAEELFDRGMAELGETGDTTFFETLTRDYPASPWAARATAVSALLKELDTGFRERAATGDERISSLQDLNLRMQRELASRQGELARKQEELARTQEELVRVRKRFAEMHLERDRLETENRQLGKQVDQLRGEIAHLQEDLVQLKNLTIEMELRR